MSGNERRQLLDSLESGQSPQDSRVWFHCLPRPRVPVCLTALGTCLRDGVLFVGTEAVAAYKSTAKYLSEKPKSIKQLAAQNSLYFLLDAVTIYSIFVMLISRMVIQVFHELKPYGKAPSPNELQSFSVGGLSVFAPAFFFMLLVKFSNIIGKQITGARKNFSEFELALLDSKLKEIHQFQSVLCLESKCLVAAVNAVYQKPCSVYYKYFSDMSAANFLRNQLSGDHIAAEAYFFALFSGSIGLMLCDLVGSTGGVIASLAGTSFTVPIELFVVLGLVGIVATVLLAMKLVFPDSSDEYVLSWKAFVKAAAPAYPPESISLGERLMNAIGGLIYALAASPALAEYNRERFDGTVAAGLDELVLLGTTLIAGAAIGAVTATDAPKIFSGYATLSRFVYGLTAGAFTYSSSEYFILGSAADKTQSGTEWSKVYIAGWASYAAVVALWHAAATRYNYEGGHEANLTITNALSNLLRCLCCRSKPPAVSAVEFDHDSNDSQEMRTSRMATRATNSPEPTPSVSPRASGAQGVFRPVSPPPSNDTQIFHKPDEKPKV